MGAQETFEGWLNGTEEAWFFLDSVDEVRLETPRAFEVAMRAFAARIHNAKQRAHVVISSRPYAWRSKLDGALIDELLPQAQAHVEFGAGEDSTEAKNTAVTPDHTLQLYQLEPLDRGDISIFSGHRGVENVDDFLGALERNALYGLAQLPFDLEVLIAIWNLTGALDSRLAVLEHGLRQRLGRTGAAMSLLSLDRALDGARRLALATTMIGEANILLPGRFGAGIDASTLLVSWSPDEVRELLSRGVFSDAIYSMVRFRHRETRELLAAKGLAEALRRTEARSDIEDLIFRKIYGETVVVPRFRPLLPWLVLFDGAIRDKTLALLPEIAIEGGDPAQLPFDTRVTFLRDIVAGIINKANRGGDNSQIARIAQPDLENAVLGLLDTYADNDDVVFFLGRLVWQGGMQVAAGRLGPIAINPNRGIYARTVSARAVLSVGKADEINAVWTALKATAEVLPRRLLAELVDSAPADVQSVERLVALLGHLEPYAHYTMTGLTQALHNFIDRLLMTSDRATERPLVQLVTGLADYLFREPFVHQGRECRVSQTYSWLIAPAIHAVERLVIGRSNASLDSTALGILTQAFALRSSGDFELREHKTKLGELVPRWIELNDALFWYAVAQARNNQKEKAEPLTDDWPVDWSGHFWHFDEASFTRTLDWIRVRELPEDRSLALSRTFRTYAQSNRPRRWRYALWRAVDGNAALEAKLIVLMRPPSDPDRKRWRSDERHWVRRRRVRETLEAHARAGFVSRLRANPESVRDPSGLRLGEMSWEQFHLLNSIKGDGLRLSRSGGGGWEALIPEFGQAVAQAFRDAAVRQWRAYSPGLRSEGVDGTRIPQALIFAMAGLEIEAGPDGRGLDTLNDCDAGHAIRYALWELNGFPSWFEPLFRSHKKVGIDFLWGEVRWELANSVSDTPMHYVLHDLVYHGAVAKLVGIAFGAFSNVTRLSDHAARSMT